MSEDQQIGAWNAFIVSRGARVQYMVNAGDDVPIRIIFGDHEELSLEFEPTKAAEVICALQSAFKDLRAERLAEDADPCSADG